MPEILPLVSDSLALPSLIPSYAMYSWKLIQREAAQQLLQFRNNQAELIKILNDMKAAGLNTILLKEKDGQELTELDPFTFLATCNRPLTVENLIANWRFLKARLNLQAPVPEDFTGAPTLLAQNCWFFGWRADRKPEDVGKLWDLATQVLETGWASVLPNLFADCLKIHSIALSKLTTGLSWIAPDECLALNATTNAYLAEHGLKVEVKTKEAYDAVLNEVRAKFQKSFPEVSHAAYVAKQAETEAKIPPEALAKLWCDFRGLFPDFQTFENPGAAFQKQELDYKQAGLNQLAAAGGNQKIRTLVETGQAQEALKLLIKAAGAKIASFYSWTKSLGNGDEAKVAKMLTAFLEVAEAPYEGPDSLAPIFKAADDLNLPPSWDTLSALLWALNPETFFPIKISYYRKFADVAGLKLPSSSPKAATFDQVLKFGQRVWEALTPQGPRNWVDVQSFIFQLGYFYANQKEDPNNPLGVPFNKLFTRVDEANEVFDLFQKCMTRLGLTAASSEDPMVSLTLRPELPMAALRFNYGNWAICTWLKKSDGAFFEFICPSDFLPPCGKTTGEEFSDRVDGKSLRLVAVPLSEVASVSEHLEQGLALVQKRFAAWTASPYKRPHRPAVFQMVFDSDWRTTCLLQGLPADEPTPDEVVPEPDAIPEPGVFEPYSIEAALQEVFIPEADLQSILLTLTRKQNIVLEGPPGVGKTFVAKRLAYILMGCKDESRVAMVQFHQSYSYEDFVQGYRPDGTGGFTIKPGLLYEFAKLAQADPDQPYFLVIDELNRGNVSKIFGELMLLVEADKRGEQFAIPLTYSKNLADKFYLPSNLHFIATMNTADRSLAVVDYALRRRFAFLRLEPAFRNRTFLLHLANSGLSAALIETICERVGHLNELIEEDQTNLGKGYKIGHSFFVPQGPIKDEAAWYKDIVNHELLPLLAEYWLDDETRLTEVAELLRR